MDKRFEAMDKRFETMDKRFEAMDKRFEAMDKRFEAMQAEMDRRFDGVEKRLDSLETGQKRIEATLIAMQNKTGTELENLVLEVMAATLQLEHIDPGKIRKEMIADVNGEVYHEKYKTDIDVLLEDGNTYLVEVKATADNHDVNTFFNHARLYERLHHVKPTGLLLVALRIKRKHLDYATSLGIRVIAGDIIKE